MDVLEPYSRFLSDGRKQCAHEGCAEAIKWDNWNKTRAHKEGWFFQKNGVIWCPDHNPDWVGEWRASRSVTLTDGTDGSGKV